METHALPRAAACPCGCVQLELREPVLVWSFLTLRVQIVWGSELSCLLHETRLPHLSSPCSQALPPLE